MNETPFYPARWQRAGRQGITLDLIVLHSTEGTELPDSAEATARYFQTIDRQASAHCAVDQDSVAYCVHIGDTAFHAAHANNRGYGIEQCGKAGQSAAQWDDAASHATILNAARVCAAVIREHPHIRPVWLLAADLLAGRVNGITSHAEVNKAWPSTGHTDPGPNYPHDKLVLAVKAILEPHPPQPPLEDEMPVIAAAKSAPGTPYLTDLLTAKRSLDSTSEVAKLKAIGVRDVGVVDDLLLADVPVVAG